MGRDLTQPETLLAPRRCERCKLEKPLERVGVGYTCAECTAIFKREYDKYLAERGRYPKPAMPWRHDRIFNPYTGEYEYRWDKWL